MLSLSDYQRLQRIAGHAARYGLGVTIDLTVEERHEAAMTAILDHLAGNGWPDDTGDLFRAAHAAIKRAERAKTKDIRHADYWLPPKTHADDPLGEGVIERIAVWQVCWALTDNEWAAVAALAEAERQGAGQAAAAAMLGWNYHTFMTRLGSARNRARALWVAPGDHPRHHYMPGKNGRKTRLQRWHDHENTRRERRQAEFEEAS